jgi:hypothetical protein
MPLPNSIPWRHVVALAIIAIVMFDVVPIAMPSENTGPSFAAENNAAMAKMMAAMAIKPSGNVDQDFAAMMIPHHQGAIDMAQAELRHGHNEQLRRLAQEIVVEQQQEIVAMRLALGQPLHGEVSPRSSGWAKFAGICRSRR